MTNWILIATLLIPSTNRVITGVDSNGIATQIEQTVIERRSTYLASSLESISIATNYVRVNIRPIPLTATNSPAATNYTKLKGLK